MPIDHSLPERRKHPRINFAYPVAFRFTNPNVDPRTFRGMIRDMSLGGACILFDFRYARIAPKEMPGLRAKLEISLPEEKPICLLAAIRWVRKEGLKEAWTLLMGIDFQDMHYWDQERIERFLALKDRDKKMLWSLWDVYRQSVEIQG